MTAGLRFAFGYPEASGTGPDLLEAGPVGEVAAAAERAGWSGFAFTEHPAPGARWMAAGGHQALDPFVALGHAAAVTTSLRLITFLAVAPYRSPALLAKAAATVDVLSGGRLTLGLGAGYLKSEFHALGVDFDERNELFDEALDVLPLHWSGEPFSYAGRHFDARDIVARPRPVQQPIPVWIGGNSRRSLRRVAERADGWMPLVAGPEVARTTRTPAVATVDDLAAKVGELHELAGERAKALDVAVPYSDPTLADPLADVDRHRDALGRLAEAGATWVLVTGPTSSRAATLAFLDAFATTYIG